MLNSSNMKTFHYTHNYKYSEMTLVSDDTSLRKIKLTFILPQNIFKSDFENKLQFLTKICLQFK